MSVSQGRACRRALRCGSSSSKAHVLGDLVHRYVAGTLDHHLHSVGFANLGQFAEGVQFGELCLVIRVGDRARAQTVAQGERDVVARDLAQFVEACGKRKDSSWCARHQAAMIDPPRDTIPVTRLAVSGFAYRSRTPACTVM